MTRKTPRLRITLHLSQMGLTLARTFIISSSCQLCCFYLNL
jgi:hypothetical protein